MELANRKRKGIQGIETGSNRAPVRRNRLGSNISRPLQIQVLNSQRRIIGQGRRARHPEVISLVAKRENAASNGTISHIGLNIAPVIVSRLGFGQLEDRIRNRTSEKVGVSTRFGYHHLVIDAGSDGASHRIISKRKSHGQ